MHTKTFLSALLSALLLCAPPAAAENVLNDRAEEYAQPPQMLEEVQDREARDWSRSVESPVSWLTIEDHVLTFYDKNDIKAYRAVYPQIELVDDDSSPLAKAFIAWNAEIGTGAWHSPIRTLSEEARSDGYELPFYYSDITPISQWGRVDDQLISFFMEGSSYAGGAHAIPHVDAYTFDRKTGRQIALDEIVTDRTMLIAALEAAFQTQYPGTIGRDFPGGVMETLLEQHPAEKGLSSFCWYMAADGSLVIYYPEAVLASYAAGPFTLTIARQDAPLLFTAAYPME
ncbi:DUF3298 domain-containing protein [uncultured Selenomonas sp.]|uniref:DUF3298 domain-containing protein n=1 Tax=uncultured Selenomonas sp. TaxID=159275 RepID=UPI0028D7D776|nr:DUF3298 domain-containing protein [uncultured Selenomonas sp.]